MGGIALVAMVATSCARVWTTYEPHKAELRNGRRPLLSTAVVAHRGDIEALVDAGGEPLGTMSARGNGFAGHDDVQEEVQLEAAALGATHVILAAEWSTADRTPDYYVTNCTSGTCTTSNAGGIAFSRPSGGYVLARVPSERWRELPLALRPGPENAGSNASCVTDPDGNQACAPAKASTSSAPSTKAKVSCYTGYDGERVCVQTAKTPTSFGGNSR
jgi:hypothetical protein